MKSKEEMREEGTKEQEEIMKIKEEKREEGN
jgi:hypothetical protein